MISFLVAKVRFEKMVDIKDVLYRYNSCWIICHWVIGFVPPEQSVAILESVLAKISRYDEGTLFSSFLSFTVRIISYFQF